PRGLGHPGRHRAPARGDHRAQRALALVELGVARPAAQATSADSACSTSARSRSASSSASRSSTSSRARFRAVSIATSSVSTAAVWRSMRAIVWSTRSATRPSVSGSLSVRILNSWPRMRTETERRALTRLLLRRVVELGVEVVELRDQLVDALGDVLPLLVRLDQPLLERAHAARALLDLAPQRGVLVAHPAVRARQGCDRALEAREGEGFAVALGNWGPPSTRSYRRGRKGGKRDRSDGRTAFCAALAGRAEALRAGSDPAVARLEPRLADEIAIDGPGGLAPLPERPDD